MKLIFILSSFKLNEIGVLLSNLILVVSNNDKSLNLDKYLRENEVLISELCFIESIQYLDLILSLLTIN
jgi:hypothetical protein